MSKRKKKHIKKPVEEIEVINITKKTLKIIKVKDLKKNYTKPKSN